MENNKQRLKIMVVNDEEDILTLYNDYLSSKGHQVIGKYIVAHNIMNDIKEHTPDIYLIDYKLPGSKNGIDAAVEILTKFPSAPILFVTADEAAASIVSKNPLLSDNRITVLLKPIKLGKLEETMLQLVSKS